VHFASCDCLSRICIPNIVHHQFWLRTLQELWYLLWFILISIIGCHVAENTNVSKVFFLVCNGPLWLAYHQNILNSSPFSSPPPKEMKCFYTIYINMENRINIIVLYLHCIKLHKIYLHSFWLTWSVSPKPYTHTTHSNLVVQIHTKNCRLQNPTPN
jgi:hypothetical protein